MNCVFLFPGQGSQSVGMGKGLYDAYAAVRLLFEEAADVTGLDLRQLCFEGPAAVLARTDHVQPAITLVNLSCLQALREDGWVPDAAAGHSLGEYAALCAAGALSFADAMRLVAARGRLMQEAAERHPGGMTAVFGASLEVLAAICAEVSADGHGEVEIANHNSPTQFVLTGDTEALRLAGVAAKKQGAKLIVPLNVSGPWHSRGMVEASEGMREPLAGARFASPSVPVIANVTGRPYRADERGIREGLRRQIVCPVRWAESMQWLIANGHRTFVEAGPGKVLAGLMRDISRDVRVSSVQDPSSLAAFHAARAVLPA